MFVSNLSDCTYRCISLPFIRFLSFDSIVSMCVSKVLICYLCGCVCVVCCMLIIKLNIDAGLRTNRARARWPPGPSKLSPWHVLCDSGPIPMCETGPSTHSKSVGAVVPRTLQESGTVVERIHPDVSAPSARQGSILGALGRLRGAVSGGTERTIESLRTRSTRRACPRVPSGYPLGTSPANLGDFLCVKGV